MGCNGFSGYQRLTVCVSESRRSIQDYFVIAHLRPSFGDFREEISAWLRDHGKGPLGGGVLKLIFALQHNFPENAEVLTSVLYEDIPYFEDHPGEFVTEVRLQEGTDDALDRSALLFESPDEVVWDKIASQDQETLRKASARALMDHWWDRAPYWERAAALLEEHLDDTGEFDNVDRACDESKCTITATFSLGEDISYDLEIEINSGMTPQELSDLLIYQYHVDFWATYGAFSDNVWDDLKYWYMEQFDGPVDGWQLATANFLADVFSHTLLVPAIHGWITGHDFRDGHELSGWEQAFAVLDFMVAEEIVNSGIKNFVVRVGGKAVSLTGIPEFTRKVISKSIGKGLRIAAQSETEFYILNQDQQFIARIVDDAFQIKIPYGDGWARQSGSAMAMKTLERIKQSRRIYRIDTLSKSQTWEAQFWSPENPFDFDAIWDYASKYGIPEENLTSGEVFFESGTLNETAIFVTREAPSFGSNLGGAIEVDVPAKDVQIGVFNTMKLTK